jgi:hypothetical protein
MADPAATVDAQMRQLRADLERQLRRTARFLERAAGRGDFGRSVEAARRVGDELADLLRRNFNAVIGRYEDASDRVERATRDSLAAEGIPEGLTAQSAASLRAQVDGTLQDVTTIAEEAITELRTLLVDVVRSQVPPEEALEQLLQKLDGAAAKAATLLDTGLAAFDREVSTQVAEEAGVEWFLYDGPVDDLTRPYCAERVGKRYRLADLDLVDNDTGPNPPSRYCGGWNCRHRLVPLLLQEELDAYPIG